MKIIILVGLALILFIPPVVSIIFGGANIGKCEQIGEGLKYLNIDKENKQ